MKTCRQWTENTDPWTLSIASIHCVVLKYVIGFEKTWLLYLFIYLFFLFIYYLFIKTLQHKCWRSVGHQVLQPTKDALHTKPNLWFCLKWIAGSVSTRRTSNWTSGFQSSSYSILYSMLSPPTNHVLHYLHEKGWSKQLEFLGVKSYSPHTIIAGKHLL